MRKYYTIITLFMVACNLGTKAGLLDHTLAAGFLAWNKPCTDKNAPFAAGDSIPEPVIPVYKKLKELYLVTQLVNRSQATIRIVAPGAYAPQGYKIQQVIRQLTGVTVPVSDRISSPQELPLTGNLILLGNRSTNPVINRLYDRGFTFLDLKYPGTGGYVVRSLHNAYGNGCNVLFAGGSDDEGVKAATAVLIRLLRSTGGRQGELSVNYLCEIRLGKDYVLTDSIQTAEIWEASRQYNSTGYFGWNTVSKNMALYYMTGKERYLKQFLRLSFPDKQAIREMEEIDGELIENKNDPLAGPYHYGAYMMMGLWDLIEESPLLTDEQRLKVTNAFARQLSHRVTEYGSIYWRTKAPESIGDRHDDWAALSLYILGLYFQKDYPSPVWKHCIEGADLYFSALENTSWMAGRNDHLFWFTTFYEPMVNYLVFSGNRDPKRMANLRHALNTQEILYTGVVNDWGLKASSLSMLNKAAYILNDGRWIYFREHTGLDTDVFRLGQSFWPGPELRSVPPADLAGHWKVEWMQKPMWKARATNIPEEQSFRWGSYRSEVGGGGDYLLLKGYNGAGRNPYHTFDILELRLKGITLLKGYHNQVLTNADGITEPKVAMDAALLYNGVVGETVAAVAEVPDLPFVTWRRSVAIRRGRYALIADDLAFRTNSDNISAETTWETPGATWIPQLGCLKIMANGTGENAQDIFELHSSDIVAVKSGKIATLNWRGAGTKRKT